MSSAEVDSLIAERSKNYKRMRGVDYKSYKLKLIDDIDMNYWNDSQGDFRLNKMGWIINSAMIPRFGNGEYYDFKPYEVSYDKYTHIGDDGFLYHESWFQAEKWFAEEDFEL